VGFLGTNRPLKWELHTFSDSLLGCRMVDFVFEERE
jgi:hypothetical protein